ncbi:hypothetical protein [Streptomyces griseorubiginosus]|uniref:hypothetical protein n=1 Tax=Streptomyces griseorubiginosus TaxID=67304 RepID=UPI001FCC1235|nr:hypothetical protein [Streptomyces griseorubiginosus]
MERKATDIAHPINVLEDAGLLHRNADVFRDNRPTYRIAEPLIGFYHAIMRPVWDQLERPGNASRVWRASRRRFTSNVLGPHFEVDLAVLAIADGSRPPLLAIGEAKWNDTMGMAHIERLQQIRELITKAGRYDTTGTRLLCLSGAGFNDTAYAAA